MRTFKEITEYIKQEFVDNEVLADMYGLDVSKTFDEQFSKVSIEAVLVYVVAMASYICERIFAETRQEVSAAIDSHYIASLPWFQSIALDYQDGYNLVYDSKTFMFGYAQKDEEARIVKFAYARNHNVDVVSWVRVFVSKDGKEPLDEAELQRFSSYMQRRAPAGTNMQIISKKSDRLQINVQINYNPLLLKSDGSRIEGSGNPVKEAIQTYVDGIPYGGVFNKTRLVDALQAAEGVVDVILGDVYTAKDDTDFTLLQGNSYISSSGGLVVDSSNISYLAENEY